MSQRVWLREWSKATFAPLRFTLTSDPSTVGRGVESWISSLRATRASPSAAQASGEAETTLDTSGPRSCGCFKSAGPLFSSAKTCAAMQVKGWKKSWPSFSATGSPSKATYSARKRRGRLTVARGSSFLPTPTASPYGTSLNVDPGDGRGSFKGKGKPSLSTMARKALWPTPTASLGTKGGRVTPRKGREGGTLIEAVAARQKWPTPTVGDSRGSGSRNLEGSKAHAGVSLTDAVCRGGSSTGAPGGPLNPTWVEVLMGWPENWTRC